MGLHESCRAPGLALSQNRQKCSNFEGSDDLIILHRVNPSFFTENTGSIVAHVAARLTQAFFMMPACSLPKKEGVCTLVVFNLLQTNNEYITSLAEVM